MNRKIALLVVVGAVAASVCLATATNAGAAHTAQGLLANFKQGGRTVSFRDPRDGLDVRFGKGVDRQADRRSRPHRQQERPAHERAARISLRGGPDQ